MPGEIQAVGFMAKLVDSLLHFVTDEDQLNEILKRRKLAHAKKECQDALARNDWAGLAAATERLRELASKP